ncbi:MAG: zinc ribbon domain-containing protein [Promethearchaeota archaeon]
MTGLAGLLMPGTHGPAEGSMDGGDAYAYYQAAVQWLQAQPLSVQIIVTVALAGVVILALVGVFYLIKYIFLGIFYILKGLYKALEWVWRKATGKEEPVVASTKGSSGVAPTGATSVPPPTAVVKVQVDPALRSKVTADTTPEKRFCAQCGHKLRAGASFCGVCGSSVGSVLADHARVKSA